MVILFRQVSLSLLHRRRFSLLKFCFLLSYCTLTKICIFFKLVLIFALLPLISYCYFISRIIHSQMDMDLSNCQNDSFSLLICNPMLMILWVIRICCIWLTILGWGLEFLVVWIDRERWTCWFWTDYFNLWGYKWWYGVQREWTWFLWTFSRLSTEYYRFQITSLQEYRVREWLLWYCKGFSSFIEIRICNLVA